MGTNGHTRQDGTTRGSARYPVPEYVVWRGKARRVLGTFPAQHQGHRAYIISATRREMLHPTAHTCTIAKAWGNGRSGWRRGTVGIVVRADSTQPFTGQVIRSGGRGRPRIIYT